MAGNRDALSSWRHSSVSHTWQPHNKCSATSYWWTNFAGSNPEPTLSTVSDLEVTLSFNFFFYKIRMMNLPVLWGCYTWDSIYKILSTFLGTQWALNKCHLLSYAWYNRYTQHSTYTTKCFSCISLIWKYNWMIRLSQRRQKTNIFFSTSSIDSISGSAVVWVLFI